MEEQGVMENDGSKLASCPCKNGARYRALRTWERRERLWEIMSGLHGQFFMLMDELNYDLQLRSVW